MTHPTLNLRPIGDADRDGRFRLVFCEGREFAVVRWLGEMWGFSSGRPLGWEPTHVHEGARTARGLHG